MSRFRGVRWSSVVRSILEQQIDELEAAEKIASKSKLTEADVRELALAADRGVAKKWKGAGLALGG